jgi:hypothetical protein
METFSKDLKSAHVNSTQQLQACDLTNIAEILLFAEDISRTPRSRHEITKLSTKGFLFLIFEPVSRTVP